MEEAFAAIGRAVIEAQAFEMVLTPIYVLYRAVTIPGFVDKHQSIPDEAWKQPLTHLVKELDKKGEIHPTLRDRLLVYADKRHTLVHRWVKQNGWPTSGRIEDFYSVIDLADEVRREAMELRKMLSGYMIIAADAEWNDHDYLAMVDRVKNFFHNAHETTPEREAEVALYIANLKD